MKKQPPSADQSPNRINHADRFGELIEAEGYSKGSIAKYRSNAQALWGALASSNLSPADLTDELMDRLAPPIIDLASAKDKYPS